MNYSLSEHAGAGTAAKRYKEPQPGEIAGVEELSRAVGQHALLQAEIDRKIAVHIVEMREQLRSAKDEVRSLQAQVDQLIHGLARALDLAPSQPTRFASANCTERSPREMRSK